MDASTPDDSSALAYIAETLLRKDSERRGLIAPRWWWVDETIQLEYLAIAERLVKAWREDELAELTKRSVNE